MPGLTRRRHARGFTLVELVITFAVIGILTLLAVPSFTTMIRNAQVRSAAEALQNGIRLAQNEAVRSSRMVVFARTAAAPALNARPANEGSNWLIQRVPVEGGLDEGAASATRNADGEQFIQGGQFTEVGNGVTITGPASICFDSDGRLVRNDNIETGLSFPGDNCLLGAGTGTPAGTPAAVAFVVTRDNLAAGQDRPLQVNVQLGGQVRMCDPAKTLNADNPDGC